ncbi:MAG: COX15/CtaA family protein [Deltaproteobacteria bacterium]|nr:COX15/CtaA family protein [Deltaproteobacteria bacterium]
MTFALVVLGGVVRLTGSGLSITTWEPLAGVIPPFSDTQWAHVFAAYRETAEYRVYNSHLAIEDFRRLYWLEYSHRLLARAVALVICLTAATTALTKPRDTWLARRLVAAVALVGAQGFVGWYMVASGLDRAPHVSHYRLALHFGLGLALLGLLADTAWRAPAHRRHLTRSLPVLLTCAIAAWSGALVAGLKAGHAFATFPLMAGAWLPDRLSSIAIGDWLNQPASVHFQHRALAFAAGIFVVARAWRSRDPLRRVLVALVWLQIGLGGLLVVTHVPAWLASMHQANALLVIICAALSSSVVRRRALVGGGESSFANRRVRAPGDESACLGGPK